MFARPGILLATLLFLTACVGDDRGPLEISGARTSASLGARFDPVPARALERPGTWVSMPDDVLWSGIEAGGGVAAVGLKAPGGVRGVYRGELLLDRGEWQNARAAVLAQPGVTLLTADDLLPILEVELSGPGALAAVRRLPFVDYVEPVRVAQSLTPWASVGGCGYGGSWPASDRQFTSEGDLYSQKFAAMRIPDAWSVSSGRGIVIGSIDTGISAHQPQLTTGFGGGESVGRWISLMQISSLSSPYDQCGHGTRMAGVIAAPRDGVDVVGVAWGANLISVRHADGVANVSSSDARQSVRLAAQNGSQIVSMAWQSMNWFWQVSDEIEYWHYRTPILFIAAAGTSGCGDGILDSNVVFPADMSVVVAVTGVTYPDQSLPCGIHYGKEVELLAYLDVPTTGQFAGEVVGIGGSSNASGVVAGVAALAWAREPGLSRDQLRTRLWESGSYYPLRDGRLGYGVVDAVKAVGGLPPAGGGGGGKGCKGKKCG